MKTDFFYMVSCVSHPILSIKKIIRGETSKGEPHASLWSPHLSRICFQQPWIPWMF